MLSTQQIQNMTLTKETHLATEAVIPPDFPKIEDAALKKLLTGNKNIHRTGNNSGPDLVYRHLLSGNASDKRQTSAGCYGDCGLEKVVS